MEFTLTHFSPETFSSIKLTTVLPKTKLENIVKRPAIATSRNKCTDKTTVQYYYVEQKVVTSSLVVAYHNVSEH